MSFRSPQKIPEISRIFGPESFHCTRNILKMWFGSERTVSSHSPRGTASHEEGMQKSRTRVIKHELCQVKKDAYLYTFSLSMQPTLCSTNGYIYSGFTSSTL